MRRAASSGACCRNAAATAPKRHAASACRAPRYGSGSARRRVEGGREPRAESRELTVHGSTAQPVLSLSKAPRRQFSVRPERCASAHQSKGERDRKSTRLNSSHVKISYAVFCLKKKKNKLSKTAQHS